MSFLSRAVPFVSKSLRFTSPQVQPLQQLHASGLKEFSGFAKSSGHGHVHVPGSGCCDGHLTGTQAQQQSRLLHSKIGEYLSEADKIKGTMPDLEDVLENNKNWVAKKNSEDPEYFKRFGAGQSPRYLYIGCSDARVDPKQLMGLKRDEVFVTRNIGNQVAPGDMNILSVLEFSIGVLKVPHIIVCGHYECGAIRGAVARPQEGGLGMLENWLRNIRDVARLYAKELNAITDEEAKHKRLVELNVMEQCFNVFKTGVVQKHRAESYKNGSMKYCLPRVHGVVFDVASGKLKKLDLPFKQDLKDYRPLYDLYQTSEPGKFDDINAEFWEGKKM